MESYTRYEYRRVAKAEKDINVGISMSSSANIWIEIRLQGPFNEVNKRERFSKR